VSEDEGRRELKEVSYSLGLDAHILEFDDGSLTPFESQVVEVKLVRVKEVKSVEEVSKKALLEVRRKEVRHVEGDLSLPGSQM
jgi:hypothetical protein